MRIGTPQFVGARLREVRESRFLSASQLAGLIGVTRQTISQYEIGLQTPSPEAMRRLVEVLNVPMHRFLQQGKEDTGIMFWRSMKSATKASRMAARSRHLWLREIVEFLQSTVQFPDINIPDFDLPKDPFQISLAKIEEVAGDVRRHWGLGDGPISNVAWLLENHGAVVVRQRLFADELDAHSRWEPSDATPYVVLGADKDAAVRSRYDASHELAHLVLHRSVKESDLENRELFNHIEMQANYFAGAFLLPAAAFRDALYSVSLDSLCAMKATWKVSIQAMLKRARGLSMINDEDEKRMWINLGRRRWRFKEPLDELLEREEPRFLRRSFDLMLKQGLLSSQEIELRLALKPSDVEAVVGLPAGYFGGEANDDGMLLKFPSHPPSHPTLWGSMEPLPFPKQDEAG